MSGLVTQLRGCAGVTAVKAESGASALYSSEMILIDRPLAVSASLPCFSASASSPNTLWRQPLQGRHLGVVVGGDALQVG